MRQQIAAKLGFTLQTATQAPIVKIEEIQNDEKALPKLFMGPPTKE